MSEKKKERIIDSLIFLLFFIFPLIIYRNPIIHNQLVVYGDGIISFSPKLFQYHSILSGEVPLWNSYVGIGTPFFADLTNTFFYPLNIIAIFLSPTLFTNLFYLIHIALAGIFSYIYLKEIGFNRLIAFSGAMVFLSSVILGVRREHVTVYTAIIWLPLILFFIERYIRIGKMRYLFCSSLIMSIQLFGGHAQWVFYSDIIVFIYFINGLVPLKESFSKKALGLFIWGGSYFLFSAAALIPQIELFFQSARGSANYFSLFSTKWPIFLMTIFPNIFGDLGHPLGNYASAEISIELYLGIIPLTYALYAIRYHHNNRVIRFSTIAIFLALVYSSICNIPYIGEAAKNIPILNFFGVQSRILFIYIFFGIVCFAYGVSDINNIQFHKRLFIHSLEILGLISLLAIAISAFAQSPLLVESVKSHNNIDSSTFWISVSIAAINVFMVGILTFLPKNIRKYSLYSNAVVCFLLVISIIDVGRFSFDYSESDYNKMLKTEETIDLGKLLGTTPFRLVTIYDQIYGGDYYKSGLVDNWSMINNLRNLKGFTEYENNNLNKLLVQGESRDNSNIGNLVSDNTILTMLSVKYVLSPITDPLPKAIPTTIDTLIFSPKGPVLIPSNGNLFVDSTPFQIDVQRYYKVEFVVDALGTDVPLFYVDLYGGPDYDRVEQEKHFSIMNGSHIYTAILYSGNGPINKDVISFRIVSISNIPLEVKDIKFYELEPAPKNADYRIVAQTHLYYILENLRAKAILYIPEQVKTITNDDDILQDPDRYPQMDRISYVNGIDDFTTGGELEILAVKNNSLTARVFSENPTFINHTQRYYPGWKAFIDGKPTPIYLVNGVIQGIEVPAGEHLIEFVYAPISLKIGGALSLLGLVLGLIYVYEEIHKESNPKAKAQWK